PQTGHANHSAPTGPPARHEAPPGEQPRPQLPDSTTPPPLGTTRRPTARRPAARPDTAPSETSRDFNVSPCHACVTATSGLISSTTVLRFHFHSESPISFFCPAPTAASNSPCPGCATRP